MICKFKRLVSDYDFDMYEESFLNCGGSAKLDRNYLSRSSVFAILNMKNELIGGFVESIKAERAVLYAGDHYEHSLLEKGISADCVLEFSSLWLRKDRKTGFTRMNVWFYLTYRVFNRRDTHYVLACAVCHSIGDLYERFFGAKALLVAVKNKNPAFETCRLYIWKKSYFGAVPVLFNVFKYSLRK